MKMKRAGRGLWLTINPCFLDQACSLAAAVSAQVVCQDLLRHPVTDRHLIVNKEIITTTMKEVKEVSEGAITTKDATLVVTNTKIEIEVSTKKEEEMVGVEQVTTTQTAATIATKEITVPEAILEATIEVGEDLTEGMGVEVAAVISADNATTSTMTVHNMMTSVHPEEEVEAEILEVVEAEILEAVVAEDIMNPITSVTNLEEVAVETTLTPEVAQISIQEVEMTSTPEAAQISTQEVEMTLTPEAEMTLTQEIITAHAEAAILDPVVVVEAGAEIAINKEETTVRAGEVTSEAEVAADITMTVRAETSEVTNAKASTMTLKGAVGAVETASEVAVEALITIDKTSVIQEEEAAGETLAAVAADSTISKVLAVAVTSVAEEAVVVLTTTDQTSEIRAGDGAAVVVILEEVAADLTTLKEVVVVAAQKVSGEVGEDIIMTDLMTSGSPEEVEVAVAASMTSKEVVEAISAAVVEEVVVAEQTQAHLLRAVGAQTTMILLMCKSKVRAREEEWGAELRLVADLADQSQLLTGEKPAHLLQQKRRTIKLGAKMRGETQMRAPKNLKRRVVVALLKVSKG